MESLKKLVAHKCVKYEIGGLKIIYLEFFYQGLKGDILLHILYIGSLDK